MIESVAFPLLLEPTPREAETRRSPRNMGAALSSAGFRDIMPCLAPRSPDKAASPKKTYGMPAFFGGRNYVNLDTGASAMSRPWLGVSLKASVSARPCLRLPDASARLRQSAGWATRAGQTSLIPRQS